MITKPRLQSKIDAELLGIARYHGKVCAKHPELGGLRYVANWECVECSRLRRKNYGERHGDKIKAYRKRRYAAIGK